MRILLLCAAVAAGVLFGRPPVQAETVNPLYVPPSDSQTNPMAGSSTAETKGGPRHGTASDASAGKGQEKTAPAKPAGPVRWSAPELNSQREKSTPEASGTVNGGAEAAVWPHMHQTATHKRGAVGPADNATEAENAKTDAARERASQDAREAARPPIMPPPMIDVPKDGMR